MAPIHRIYTKDIYKNLKYRPTWLPGTPLDVGVIGVIEDDVLRPISTLKRLGIPYELTRDPLPDGAMDFASSGGSSVTLKASGDLNSEFKVLSSAQAGALVKFTRAGAVVLQLRGVTSRRIADQPALYRDLLRSIAGGDESKQWLRDWVVITEIVAADSEEQADIVK